MASPKARFLCSMIDSYIQSMSPNKAEVENKHKGKLSGAQKPSCLIRCLRERERERERKRDESEKRER